MLRELIHKTEQSAMYSSGNKIYTGEPNHVIAATFGEDKIQLAHRLSASESMAIALEELERINFGANGSMKEFHSAILIARNALAKYRGDVC